MRNGHFSLFLRCEKRNKQNVKRARALKKCALCLSSQRSRLQRQWSASKR